MCDVVFITPNMNGSIGEEVIGTLQLATILSQNGISCDILQFVRIGNPGELENFLENAIHILAEKKPKIVSFYTRCDSYHIDIKLAQRIKKQWNDMYIVFGGPQSDITAEETVRQLDCVDFVCCGEGENTIYPFFSSLLRGQPDLSVPGLVYRKAGAVQKNDRPVLIEDLDSIPQIDYSLFYFPESEGNKTRFRIDVGRGCPFGCTFCSTKTFWGRKYRLKSPARIMEEVKSAYEKFGVTKFAFSHDMFTLNRDKVIETCKLLKTLPFPVNWACSARLDCIDEELIDIMIDAGMSGMFIGIETGSPRMQKLIKKNLSLENAVEKIAYLKERGATAVVSFIHGFPEETEEDLSQTLCLIREVSKLKTRSIQSHLCAFFAGTELTERFLPAMTRTEQYSDNTGDFAIEQCEDVITAYPQLFPHFLEYKTELRTRLKHYGTFLRAWRFLQPVYQYISEKYPPERLIDMYFDYVRVNWEILEQLGEVDNEHWLELIENDRFIEQFADDCNYDLLSDFYRMAVLEYSIPKESRVTDAFCFSPAERNLHEKIQDYTRKFTVVTYQKDKNGWLRIGIRKDG